MKKIRNKILTFSLINTFVLLLLMGYMSNIIMMQTQKTSLSTLENSMRNSFDLLISTQVQNAASVLQNYVVMAENGDLSHEEAKKRAAAVLRGMKYGVDGYFWADTYEGVNVVLLGNDKEGKNRYESQDGLGNYYMKDIIKYGREEGGGYSDYYFPKKGSDTPLPKRSYSLEFKPFGWVIGTGNYTNDIDEVILTQKAKMEKESKKKLLILNGLSLLIGAIFAGMSIVFGKRIANPIEETSKLVKTVSSGDFTVEIPGVYLKRKDEIGQISNALQHMIENLRGMIKGVMIQSKHTADVSLKVYEDIGVLQSQINDIAATTEQMSAGMEETAASSQQMNAMAMEIDHAAESIAEKAQEGSKTANDINDRAIVLRAKLVASENNAMTILNDSKVTLEEAIEMSKSVHQITSLSDVILEITSQTNLLALNAAIEAARAGEAGRGFAVVADEIRKLADNSNTIATQIQEVIKVVENSVTNLSSNSYKLLEFVSTDIKKDYKLMLDSSDQYGEDAADINDLIMNFSATSEELLASIQNMKQSIEEITVATTEGAQGVSDIATNTGVVLEKYGEIIEVTHEVKEGSIKLNQEVEKFKI